MTSRGVPLWIWCLLPVKAIANLKRPDTTLTRSNAFALRPPYGAPPRLIILRARSRFGIFLYLDLVRNQKRYLIRNLDWGKLAWGAESGQYRERFSGRDHDLERDQYEDEGIHSISTGRSRRRRPVREGSGANDARRVRKIRDNAALALTYLTRHSP
ncbi:hypothetical protein EVAR_102293_1 [Eumeta japonica]|uniref:Secreted protein n=1 Tax=Eumeta variegata TaxID=151549 RepID=A0A4C1WJM5_EUMVA|nr:hypothetical protein EVAR_102293_1 [Eumeta japonica]